LVAMSKHRRGAVVGLVLVFSPLVLLIYMNRNASEHAIYHQPDDCCETGVCAWTDQLHAEP